MTDKKNSAMFFLVRNFIFRSRGEKKRKRKSRSRSGSPSRGRHRRNRSRSTERRNREKERERERRGLPPLKTRHVSSKNLNLFESFNFFFNILCFVFVFLVCSRTLWFGRVPMYCKQEEIKQAIKEYGEPVSIDVRGVDGSFFNLSVMILVFYVAHSSSWMRIRCHARSQISVQSFRPT